MVGIDVLAWDPVPKNRPWVPLMKTKNRRHKFPSVVEAQDAIDAMRRGNATLELRIVPVEDEA